MFLSAWSKVVFIKGLSWVLSISSKCIMKHLASAQHVDIEYHKLTTCCYLINGSSWHIGSKSPSVRIFLYSFITGIWYNTVQWNSRLESWLPCLSPPIFFWTVADNSALSRCLKKPGCQLQAYNRDSAPVHLVTYHFRKAGGNQRPEHKCDLSFQECHPQPYDILRTY